MDTKQIPWTIFLDMHSGGGQKLEWAEIYIQAPKEEAKIVFQNLFGRNPERVTCTCCGPDYSVSESPSLENASAYHRGLRCTKRSDKTWCEMTLEERVEENQKNLYLEPGIPVPDGYVVDMYFREDEGVTLDEYKKQEGVKIVPASEISSDERRGELRREGYIWAGD